MSNERLTLVIDAPTDAVTRARIIAMRDRHAPRAQIVAVHTEGMRAPQISWRDVVVPAPQDLATTRNRLMARVQTPDVLFLRPIDGVFDGTSLARGMMWLRRGVDVVAGPLVGSGVRDDACGMLRVQHDRVAWQRMQGRVRVPRVVDIVAPSFFARAASVRALGFRTQRTDALTHLDFFVRARMARFTVAFDPAIELVRRDGALPTTTMSTLASDGCDATTLRALAARRAPGARDLPTRARAPRHIGRVAVVAILRDEERFLDEWLAYHRLVGVGHFYLYDNDPRLPLRRHLRAERDVTVLPWSDEHAHLAGRNKQTKAYEDALRHVREEWVAFIDGDEFIALRSHDDVGTFVAQFPHASAIQLRWLLFGHNGHVEDPPSVLAALTRRRPEPQRLTKSINRVDDVKGLTGAHRCTFVRRTHVVDCHGEPFVEGTIPDDIGSAQVHHYMCRSYATWMRRIPRGEVASDIERADQQHTWRFDADACAAQFAELARTFNAHADPYMLAFVPRVQAEVTRIRRRRARARATR